MKRGASRRVVEKLARQDIRGPSRARAAATLDERELPAALERGELVLHYQPIVDLRSGECRRVEALIRWRHPRFGLLLPGDFMPRDPELLARIGAWVLRDACAQVVDWHANGERLGVAINVSGPELEALDDMAAALRPIASGAITFEISPQRVSMDPRIRSVLSKLAATGARISLDGVGPEDTPGRTIAADLDELKLSRALVRRAPADGSALADLRGLIELARDYRLASVAVGIEDRATRDLVASLGCELGQGFWVSKPLVPDRLGPWRRWVSGVALGGALAFAAHVGSGKAAASAGGNPQVPTEVTGLLPTICSLDLPLANSCTTAEQLEARTGRAFHETHTARADVFIEAAVRSSARVAIANAVDRNMAELAEEFRHDFSSRPSIYVFATRTSFALGLQQVFGVRGPDAGLLAAANGGVTLPRQNAIVINLQNVSADEGFGIVRHELTHALVHQIVGPNGELPAWFDEGLATLQERKGVSDDAAGARGSATTLSLLSVGRTSLGALNELTVWAQRNAELDGQAYTVAADAVRLLEHRTSHEGLVRILESVGRGSSFGVAYAEEAGESLGDFERSFPARLAADQETARVLHMSHEDGVRWTIAGFPPRSTVTIAINGRGYALEYEVKADHLGMFQGVFGSTAPPGEYTIRATGSGATASTVIRT